MSINLTIEELETEIRKVKPDIKDSSLTAYVNQLTSKLSTKLRSLIKTHESTRGNNYGVTMVHNGRVANSTLSSGGAGGRSAFFKAFYGRQAFYEKNIDKGVFKSMKKILQKYPELRVLDK